MNADADMNLLVGLLLGVVSTELSLNALGALDRVDDGGKVYQESITNGFDDVTMRLGHLLLDDPVMNRQHTQHAGFIGAHLAAEAHDVGEHDGSQFARLCRRLW